MDERGGGRLAVGAGDADDLVRRKLGPGAGEQLDVADDLDAGVARALRDRVAVERQAGRDDEAVELREVDFVEVGDVLGCRGTGSASSSLASSFASHARRPSGAAASSASTVARPERARP